LNLRRIEVLLATILILLTVMMPTLVYAPPPVSVTVTPTSQFVLQGSTATYQVNLVGSWYNEPYHLSVLGLPSGSVKSAPSITTVAGAGSGNIVLDAGSLPGLYCPNTYTFQVQATSASAPPDIGTSSVASVTVTPVGPPLHVTLTSDKPTYRIGDKVSLSISTNRPSKGILTITPPSGSPSTFSYYTYGPTYAITRTLTADKIGRYGVAFQADDFCSGFDSAQIFFDVTPDTYDVTISLGGVPSDVSVNINVDGTAQGTMMGSEIKSLTFKLDTTHAVTLDQYVSGETGYRYYCAQNTWNVASAGSRTFEYETQVQLTVSTDPSGVTQVSGDGWYRSGSVIQTSQAPESLPGAAGTRYVFKGWTVDGVLQSGNQISLTMDKPHTAVATYETQYQLIVDSQYGDPKGTGYYASGSTATFSVTTPVGVIIQQVFTGWDGDFTGTSPTGSITMDKPHNVHANWTTSYFQLYLIIGVLAAIAVVAGLLLWRRRAGMAPPETKPTPPATGEPEQPTEELLPASGETVPCPSCGTAVPVGQTYCQNCGTKIA
jgi:hypothetical protein